MVFKPSFKCLKNKKINFSPAILKLETLLFKNIYIDSSYIIFEERFGFKKKKCHLFFFVFFKSLFETY